MSKRTEYLCLRKISNFIILEIDTNHVANKTTKELLDELTLSKSDMANSKPSQIAQWFSNPTIQINNRRVALNLRHLTENLRQLKLGDLVDYQIN